MKALVCREWCEPEGLAPADVPVPEPGAGQVRIAVHACGVNFADTLIIAGKYQERPKRPFSPGLEVAGAVSALGAGVAGLAVGQRVIALCGHGGFAEEVVAPAGSVSPIPESMDFVTAAGFTVAYGTAHVALDYKARLCPGETLMVHGAGGGVGLAAVEVGKRMGAHVIASAGSEDKLALAGEYGADHFVDYSRGGFRDQVKDLTDGRGADVIFDPVGGEVFDESLRCVAWDGRILVIGFASGTIPQVPANIALVKSVSVMGLYWGAYARRKPEVLTGSWRTLLDWHAEGTLAPHVSRVYPLEEGGAALRALLERKTTGKVVVAIRSL